MANQVNNHREFYCANYYHFYSHINENYIDEFFVFYAVGWWLVSNHLILEGNVLDDR